MARQKKEIPTQEELEAQGIARSLKEKVELLHFIPTPTYFYDIGDSVDIGALEDVVVLESLYDGKIYRIKYSVTHPNYGKPYKTFGHQRYVSWLDIRKVDKSSDSLIVNEDVEFHYSNRTMGDIFSKVYHFGVNFDPEYQRGYVWDLSDKVALIDSIFNHVDIGKFVFIHKDYSDKFLYEILDGKQRIRAICDFYEDRFQYKGKFFSDLCTRDKYFFDGYPIVIAEVQDITPQQIYKYFIKLNTSGRVMDKEHLDKVRALIKEET